MMLQRRIILAENQAPPLLLRNAAVTVAKIPNALGGIIANAAKRINPAPEDAMATAATLFGFAVILEPSKTPQTELSLQSQLRMN